MTSRGRIGIDSDLKAKPLVVPWLKSDEDKAIMVQAVKDVLSESFARSQEETIQTIIFSHRCCSEQ